VSNNRTDTMLEVQLAERDARTVPLRLPITQVLLAGYTGRDRGKVLEHIHELEQLGVAPPPRVPMVYEVLPALITSAERITVNEPQTSGEVEFYLVPTEQGLIVGLGSDHTDRKQEAVDVAYSKTLCSKVVSRTVWRYADVRDHWDRLEIRSWATEGGRRRIYQSGALDEFLRVEEVLSALERAGYTDLDGRLIFGGTFPTAEGFVYADRFESELRDPVLGRTLHCAYDVIVA
jgi:hypothetical protein